MTLLSNNPYQYAVVIVDEVLEHLLDEVDQPYDNRIAPFLSHGQIQCPQCQHVLDFEHEVHSHYEVPIFESIISQARRDFCCLLISL